MNFFKPYRHNVQCGTGLRRISFTCSSLTRQGLAVLLPYRIKNYFPPDETQVHHRGFLFSFRKYPYPSGIGNAMRHAHMAHNFLKRCIINVLMGPKMRPGHVMGCRLFYDEHFHSASKRGSPSKMHVFRVLFTFSTFRLLTVNLSK